MKATVYDLDNGIGVCLLTDGRLLWVAEVRFNPLRVLPQSMRVVTEVTDAEVEVSDEATVQDHVSRSATGIARFRTRLAEFDPGWPAEADLREWTKEALALRGQLDALLLELGMVP